MDLGFFKKTYERNKSRYVDELIKFLSFKSISADPKFNVDCAKCAEWLVEHLEGIGFEAELIKTSAQPPEGAFLRALRCAAGRSAE